MDELKQVLKAYAAFEAEVGAFSSELWFQWCSNCREVCCKPVYCRETLESPFLFLLSKNHSPEVFYSTQKAWLSETGCKLSIGRPPVCYEFLCGTILEAQQPGIERYAMIVLSKLISYIGKRALGSRHLIEVMDLDDLKKIKYSRFQKRLAEARDAIDVIQLYYRGHKLEKEHLKFLSKISSLNLGKGNSIIGNIGGE
ncbi:MAG: hypothetical protein WCB15_19170 [Desulfobacterales bacterium]|jgi:hypothetical protein